MEVVDTDGCVCRSVESNLLPVQPGSLHPHALCLLLYRGRGFLRVQKGECDAAQAYWWVCGVTCDRHETLNPLPLARADMGQNAPGKGWYGPMCTWQGLIWAKVHLARADMGQSAPGKGWYGPKCTGLCAPTRPDTGWKPHTNTVIELWW